MELSRTLWRMRSDAGREITAAIYDVLTGRELRVSRGDSLLESRLSRSDDAGLEQRAAEILEILSSKGWERCARPTRLVVVPNARRWRLSRLLSNNSLRPSRCE